MQDPIADAARAILDGHIVLSRELADAGHYPAIDIEKSISRVMPQVTSETHLQHARVLKQIYSLYQQNKDLITLGAYQTGSDPMLDKTIEMMPGINHFLQQGMTDVIPYDEGLVSLAKILGQA
jgi:flagellum-specific ATP synthase